MLRNGDNFLRKPGIKVREPRQTDRQTDYCNPLTHAPRRGLTMVKDGITPSLDLAT